jgi:hypothetical protein
MTQKGLLRTLLFQIFLSSPELTPVVTRKKWEALHLFKENDLSWELYKLTTAVKLASRGASQDYKLCLFVDGLDEFDGDHKALIDLFRELSTNHAVKLCVSSRPRVVFQDTFECKPSLMLQDLTYRDIKHYVSSHTSNDQGFKLLQLGQPEYAGQLVENIV